LGIDAALRFLGKFFSPADREMVGVFLGFHEGALRIEPAEVARVEYVSPDRLTQELPTMNVTSFVERALPMVVGALNRP
jgi:hypothetical protein